MSGLAMKLSFKWHSQGGIVDDLRQFEQLAGQQAHPHCLSPRRILVQRCCQIFQSIGRHGRLPRLTSST